MMERGGEGAARRGNGRTGGRGDGDCASLGVEASLLYRWRRQFASERRAPTFVPLQIEAEVSETSLPTDFVRSLATPPTAPPASIAISFGEQVRVTVEGAPDATTLANVMGVVTAGGRWR